MDRRKHRRENLPYGMWICADGREVLHNRRYKPIWERRDGIVSAAHRNEHVEHVAAIWFYDDGDTGLNHAALCRRLASIVAEFWMGMSLDHHIWRQRWDRERGFETPDGRRVA
jgi:hypothetical protein